MPVPVNVAVGPDQLIKIVLRGHLQGQLFLNVYYYATDPGDAPVNYLTQLLAWYNLAASVYPACMCNLSTIQDATMVLYTSGGSPVTPTMFMPVSPTNGTAGSTPMPSQVCGLITRRVVRLTNSNRGRVYVPFPSTAFGSASEIPNLTYQGRMQTLSDLLLPLTVPLLITGQHWSPGLMRFPGGAFQDLFASEVQPKWATQKRRGDYGRLNNT